MFEVGFHARAWYILRSSSSLKSCIILSVVNLERSVDTSFAYQKLKEHLHKAISVELRTSIKNILWVAVDWGDSSEVTGCSHDPDFFIAVLGEVGGDKEIFPLSDGSNQETAARPDT